MADMAHDDTPRERITSTLGDIALLLLGVAVILGLGVFASAYIYTAFSRSLSSARPAEWVLADYIIVVGVGALGLFFMGFLLMILFETIKGLRASTSEVADAAGAIRERRRELARGRAWREAERERLERETGGALSMSEDAAGGGELSVTGEAGEGALEEVESHQQA